MVTSIVSAFTNVPVRKDVAMTGEITLRGRVLPIGGLKEKLLAALRGGIKTVLIPKDNEKDLIEVPENVKKKIKIIPITLIDEALNYALSSQFKIEVDIKSSISTTLSKKDNENKDIVTH